MSLPIKMENSPAPKAKRPKSGDEMLRCKRRIQFNPSSSGFALQPANPPPAVARRNERERNRVRMVNNGFNTLRQHVPNGVKNKKMSKVETLKSAVDYIRQLQQLLTEQESGSSSDSGSQGGSQENCYPRFPAGSSVSSVQSPAYSAASSPTPSWNSDASSPYNSYSPAQEEEEIMDFAAWFS